MTPTDEPSRLRQDVLSRIVELIRARDLPAGARLSELGLARELRVSRTPVRGALRLLAERGVLEAEPRRGFFLRRPAAAVTPVGSPSEPDEGDRLYLAIARDRLAGALPGHFSEADMLRRYGVGRSLLAGVLGRMAEIGLVERNLGHGWTFLPAIDSAEARAESYRFRLLIEPAALLEPGFRLDPDWARRIRARHDATLRTPWRDTASIAFYEMNADFHDGLAAACGNRYLHMAVQQQNRLRRFLNYDWPHGEGRVHASCREHLDILDRLEAGDREFAALLMRRHLEHAAGLIRHFQDAAC